MRRADRPEDKYCYYCGKQYADYSVFKRHVITRHGAGMARVLCLLTPEEEMARWASLSPEERADEILVSHVRGLQTNRAKNAAAAAARARAARKAGA